MHTSHECGVPEFGLKVESNPKSKHWKSDETEADYRKQLHMSVKVLRQCTLTHQREISIFPYCHVNHRIWILYLPYYE
jgi:hypothetical protein